MALTGDLVQVGSLNAGRIVATRVDVGAAGPRRARRSPWWRCRRSRRAPPPGAGPRMGVTGNARHAGPRLRPADRHRGRADGLRRRDGRGRPADLRPGRSDPGLGQGEHRGGERLAGRGSASRSTSTSTRSTATSSGRVDAITPASAATFSLLPANNASGNFTKVTQYVPVKIAVDARGARAAARHVRRGPDPGPRAG